jgi:hypothetical protein
MRNIISELLAIEKTAREACDPAALSDTNFLIIKEIDRGIAALERDADTRIIEMERESLAETAERLAQIKENYQRRANELGEAFTLNREERLAQILEDILYE